MSFITYNYIDRFLVVYLDDIVVYSESLEDHLSHLRKVLTRLREHKLYVKMEKCELLCPTGIIYFGHLISKGQVRMDGRKVQAIVDWTPPTKVSEARSPANAIQEGSAPSTLFEFQILMASATRVELRKAMKRKGTERVLLRNERI